MPSSQPKSNLIPYTICPNLETELVVQFLETFEAKRTDIYAAVLLDKENGFLFHKLIKNSLSKVDWGWIQKKYPERVGWYVQDS